MRRLAVKSCATLDIDCNDPIGIEVSLFLSSRIIELTRKILKYMRNLTAGTKAKIASIDTINPSSVTR